MRVSLSPNPRRQRRGLLDALRSTTDVGRTGKCNMWNRKSAVICPRRGFLQLAIGATMGVAAAAAWPRAASADIYPSRTVRIITPFGSAGAPDIITRMLAQWLTERLGQSFVVEIRAGGAGQI